MVEIHCLREKNTGNIHLVSTNHFTILEMINKYPQIYEMVHFDVDLKNMIVLNEKQ